MKNQKEWISSVLSHQVLGLTQPPFILDATMEKNFGNYRESFGDVIKTIGKNMYVNDLVTGEILLIWSNKLKKI